MLETGFWKKLGHYKIEHINNSCQSVLTVNPKECFGYFENQKLNNKHKGVKKGLPGVVCEKEIK